MIAEVHKEGVDGLINHFGLKVSPTVRCGGHQTFSMGANFPGIVARNVVQLVRYYLPALLWISCVHGTSHREGGVYRNIPVSGWSRSLEGGRGRNVEETDECPREAADYPFNNKYSAVHIKADKAVRIDPYLLEFRYPDGIKFSNIHHLTAIVNAALIARAIDISVHGVPEIPQARFNKTKEEVYQFYETEKFIDECWVLNLIGEMMCEFEIDFTALGYNPQVIREAVNDLVQSPRWKMRERQIQDIAPIPMDVLGSVTQTMLVRPEVVAAQPTIRVATPRQAEQFQISYDEWMNTTNTLPWADISVGRDEAMRRTDGVDDAASMQDTRRLVEMYEAERNAREAERRNRR
jgi:hypothetical protein